MTATLLHFAVDNVMQPRPWPIVLDADGSTIVSGRPDAASIIGWVERGGTAASFTATPTVGYGPVFAAHNGEWFTSGGTYLAAEPTPYEGDLDRLRKEEAKRREAWERVGGK